MRNQNLTVNTRRVMVRNGRIAGFELSNGEESEVMHLTAIVDRLEARWHAIAQELAELDAWWARPFTTKSTANIGWYHARTQELKDERSRVEAAWVQIRPFLDHNEVSQ